VVLLDLARATWGEAVRPWQYAGLLLALGLVASVLRARGLSWKEAGPVLGLGLLLVPAAADHNREIRSDGVHYYSYLRSALFDRDLDLTNDYPLLGSDYKAKNVLPVGAPLLWSPLVSVVHLARVVGGFFGLDPPNGTEPGYAAAVCLASFVYGSAGLFILLRVLLGAGTPAAAFWTTVIVWVASPLRFYLSVLPSMAHACEFFAAVLVLWSVLVLRDRPYGPEAFRAGLACGLLFLVRSQDGLLLILPVLLLASRFVDRDARPAAFGALVRLGAGFALAALPQLAVWQVQFGVPLLVPHKTLHGEGFFHAADPQLAGTLLSPRGGLFVNYPALFAAFVGLVWLAVGSRRANAGQRSAASPAPRFDALYVLCLLPVLVLAWWLNASVFDWYQVRRYTGLVPFLAPGLLAILTPLTRAGTLPMALVALLAWSYDDAVDARRTNPGDPVPVRVALYTAADRLAADAYRLLEPVAPRAATVLLASFSGDAVLEEEVTYVDLSATTLVSLPRPAVHLSEPEVVDGRLARWVQERYARLFVPLAWRGPLLVRIEARALETREPQVVSFEWNETACGEQPMEPAWREYTFPVPAEAVRIGTNALVVRFSRAPIYFRVRGEGPRVIRPAALSLLTLHRAGPASR
jgi:hypothetical protein